MSLFKTFFRVGLILTVAGALIFLVAGPHRTAALVDKAQGAINHAIDETIDDPTLLRAQLRELESQYPERISDVRGDLAEVLEQLRQVEREKAVSERVVALTDRDLDALEPLVAEARTASLAAAPGQLVRVRFDSATLDVDDASRRLQQIAGTRQVYANRAADAVRDLRYLAQQRDRLQELLEQLEVERAEFRSQLWQLDRQVDAIARNDRLIELMEKRQRTIDECSRYQSVSLDGVRARMAELRTRQEAELEQLAGDQQRLDYEQVARLEYGTGALGAATAEEATLEHVTVIEAPLVHSGPLPPPPAPRPR